MDIEKIYEDIQNKYSLKDKVQELYLYEKYLQVCLNYFKQNSDRKAAIYGGGKNTAELMKSAIWEQIRPHIEVIIDNHTQDSHIQGIQVDKVNNLPLHKIDFVFISTWAYRKELTKEIKEKFPAMTVFDPYEKVMDELPQIKTAFFAYKGINKYQWFAERRRRLKAEPEPLDVLKELIHGYYTIYDWVNLKKSIEVYCSYDKAEVKKYSALKDEVEKYLEKIKKTIDNRKQEDCMIFMVDALSKYVVGDMHHLSKWRESSLSFEKFINEYPATREVIMALLTGWHPFEEKTYLERKLEYSDSELLEYIQEEKIELKYISAANVRSTYVKINAYQQGLKEDVLLSEVIFRGISSLCSSDKRQVIIMHTLDTVHPLHWNPISSNLTWKNTSWKDHKNRFEESVRYTDEMLNFYLEILYENETLTKIVMGDHGINLKTEYAHDIACETIEGNIGLWDMETISPALMIWGGKYQAKEIEKAVSTNSFYKILYGVLKNEDIEDKLEERSFLELEFVPGYNESWIKRVISSGNHYLGMGLRGIITENFIFTSFEDGTERLFRIKGKKLEECIEQKCLFIKEIKKKEIYESCKFPDPILEDNFFIHHKKWYQLKNNI